MPISNVYNIDCMEGMKEFPDRFFDLAIVDPPYGININKSAYINANNKIARQKNGSILRVKKQQIKAGNWDSNIPCENYFTQLKRISKHQIIWGWNYYGLIWGQGLIKWDKCRPDGLSFSGHEYAFCSLLDREIELKYLWSGMMQAESLQNPTKMQGNKRLNEKRIHPTQKPIPLYQWLLKNYAKPGDKILDTHLGSGSSRIAAYKMGFDFWGYELDKEYYEAQDKRFKEAIAEPLFDQVKSEQQNIYGDQDLFTGGFDL